LELAAVKVGAHGSQFEKDGKNPSSIPEKGILDREGG